MDTPSALDTALNNAFDSTVGEEEVKPTEPVAEVEQPEEVKPEEAKTEEVQEEGFTKVNPAELPEELKPIYKGLVADYTRKRQVETAEVKTVRAENEQLKAQLEELLQGREPEAEEHQDSRPLTAEDVERIFIERQESAWEKQAQADIPTIDGRLDEHNPIEYDEDLFIKVITKLDEELTSYEAEKGTKLGFNYKQVAEEVIKNYDKKLESKFKSWSQKQTNLVREKADNFKKSAPATSTAKGVKATGKVSLDEAINTAFGD